MDSSQLDRLERLAKAATQGPWKNEPDENFFDHDCQIVRSDTAFVCEFVTEANAAYIVAACNSLPDLIAENRALQERAQMRQELVEQYEQDIAKLRQKVRELERQTVILASHLSKYVMHTMSTKEWLEWSERTAKEAGK